MSYADTAALAENPTFQQRITAAAVEAALQIFGEAPDEQHPARTTKRQDLARAVLNQAAAHTSRIAWAVAANPTISAAGTNTTDNDIAYVITTVWDDLADVTHADTQDTPEPEPQAPAEEPPAEG